MHDRGRAHHQRWRVRRLGLVEMREPCERLQRLAQTHVVGEHGAEPDARSPRQEVEALVLVRAHLGLEPLGLRHARQAGELRQPLAQRTHRLEVGRRRAERLERIETGGIGLRELPQRHAHFAGTGFQPQIREPLGRLVELLEIGAAHPTTRQLHERCAARAQQRQVLLLQRQALGLPFGGHGEPVHAGRRHAHRGHRAPRLEQPARAGVGEPAHATRARLPRIGQRIEHVAREPQPPTARRAQRHTRAAPALARLIALRQRLDPLDHGLHVFGIGQLEPRALATLDLVRVAIRGRQVRERGHRGARARVGLRGGHRGGGLLGLRFGVEFGFVLGGCGRNLGERRRLGRRHRFGGLGLGIAHGDRFHAGHHGVVGLEPHPAERGPVLEHRTLGRDRTRRPLRRARRGEHAHAQPVVRRELEAADHIDVVDAREPAQRRAHHRERARQLLEHGAVVAAQREPALLQQLHDFLGRFIDDAHEAPARQRHVRAPARGEPERRQQHGVLECARGAVGPFERQFQPRRLATRVAYGHDAHFDRVQAGARARLDPRACGECLGQVRAPREVRRLGHAIEQRLHALAREFDARAAGRMRRRELRRRERAQQPRLGRREQHGLALEIARELLQLPPRARCILQSAAGDARLQRQHGTERSGLQLQHGTQPARFRGAALGPVRQRFHGMIVPARLGRVGRIGLALAHVQARGFGRELGRCELGPARMLPAAGATRLGQQQHRERIRVLAGTPGRARAQARRAVLVPRPARHEVVAVGDVGAHAARIGADSAQVRGYGELAAAGGAIGGQLGDRFAQRVERHAWQAFCQHGQGGVHPRSIRASGLQAQVWVLSPASPRFRARATVAPSAEPPHVSATSRRKPPWPRTCIP